MACMFAFDVVNDTAQVGTRRVLRCPLNQRWGLRPPTYEHTPPVGASPVGDSTLLSFDAVHRVTNGQFGEVN